VIGINAMIIGGDQSVSIASSVVVDFMKKANQNGNLAAKRSTPNDVF
jgi:hypothetical protein